MKERALGIQHYDSDNYSKAIFYFDKILKPSSKDFGAWLARGDCYRLLARPAEAVSDLTKALSLNPNSAFALFSRGEAYRQLEDYEKSIADLERYLELTPDNKFEPRDCVVIGFVYVELRRFPEAIRFFEKELAQNPKSVETWLKLGRALFLSSGDIQRILFCLEEAARLDPRDSKAQVYLAQAYFVTGDYNKAVSAGTKAIELDAKRYAGWMYRGQALLMSGSNQERAVEDVVTAVRVAVAHNKEYAWEAWKVLGVVNRILGNPKAAQDNLTISIELNSSNADAWVQRGVVNYQLGQGYYENALIDFTQALVLNPHNQYAQAWLYSLEQLDKSLHQSYVSQPPQPELSKTSVTIPSAPPVEVVFDPPPYSSVWAKNHVNSNRVAAETGFFARLRNLFSSHSNSSRLPPPQIPGYTVK